MPDIDPAALSRSDSTITLNPTSSISSKSLSISATAAQKAKAVQSTPRVDIEPLYTALKAIIGDHWSTYRDAVSQFVLGHLNQDELGHLTDHFIAVDASRINLHNQLICGIHANVLRDPPEQAVASWVSANDKPSGSGLKQATGDAAEQRLKVEAMSLPPRVRHRLKGISDDNTVPPILQQLNAYQAFHTVHTASSTGPSNAASASASADASSTAIPNNDASIRRRFAQPLIAELRDLPPPSALTDRLIPICYEEGLSKGPASPQSCAELLSTAAETFIKEALASLFARTRSDMPVSGPFAGQTGVPPPTLAEPGANGPGGIGGNYVMTAKYKQQLEAEEEAFERGEVKRNEMGLLPCEVLASQKSGGGGRGLLGDLKVAWEMGAPGLGGMVPWVGEKVVLGEGFDGYLEWDGEVEMKEEEDGLVSMVNGVGLVNGNADVNGAHDDDAMTIDEEDWGWQGGLGRDRDALTSLLDDCLAVGQ